MSSYNKILQLLAEGQEPDAILATMSKTGGKVFDRIKNMLLGGYGTGQILNLLAKDEKIQKELPRNFKPATAADIARISILKGKMGADKSNDEMALNELKQFTQKGAQAAALLGSVYGGGKLAGRLLGAGENAGKIAPAAIPPVTQTANRLPLTGINKPKPTMLQVQSPAPMNPSAPPPQQTIMQAKQPGITAPVAQNIASSEVPIEPQMPQPSDIPVVPMMSPSDVLKQKKLDTLIDSMNKAGHKPEDIMEYLQESHPEFVAGIEKQTKEPLINSIYRYMGKKMKKPKVTEGLQEQFQQQYGAQNGQEINESPEQIQPAEANGAANQLQQRDQGQEVAKSTESEAPKQNKGKGNVITLPSGEIGTIEDLKKDHAIVNVDGKRRPIKQSEIEDSTETIGSLAITPEGDLGNIKSIDGDKVTIDVDGKSKTVRMSDVQLETPDVERAARTLVNAIPEKSKSTAMASAIHVPIPGLDLMVVKFHDGKVAWYRDVPEKLYESIALGTYSPKTKKKTGIAEYTPGVFDSRGAGFSEQLSRNPKYGKDTKGIMWGYANNLYDFLSDVQPIFHKLSKEEYDEEGNIKQKRAKKEK